ncbi:MAG TPA: ATP-binding protein [Thermomicrobiales bacterium]|nr:ATP-binding protein [Thermomicrobiales bacterium]
MATEERIDLVGEESIVVARRRAREYVRGLGFGLLDQSRIATAVSELTRNVIRYAIDSRGEVVIRELPESGTRIGVEIVVSDAGPGIDDVSQAMRDGYTSGRGLGLGLPGTRRLVDEMEIDSGRGRGTTVTIRKWRP